MTRKKNRPEGEGPWHIGAVRTGDETEVVGAGVQIRASRDASTRWYDMEVVWRCNLPISKDTIRMVEAGFREAGYMKTAWNRLLPDNLPTGGKA